MRGVINENIFLLFIVVVVNVSFDFLENGDVMFLVVCFENFFGVLGMKFVILELWLVVGEVVVIIELVFFLLKNFGLDFVNIVSVSVKL